MRVVIADDHAIFREGIVSLLTKLGGAEVVGQADNWRTLIEAVEETRPDIAIVDVSMPGVGLTAALGRLKDVAATKFIALTMHDEPLVAQRVLRAGVAGYVLKQGPSSELLDALAAVAGGGTYVSAEIGTKLVLAPNRETPLSPREQEVLQMIAAGRSNKEVARELGISVRTVDTHRTRIMRKLDVHSAAELVRHALDQGLITPSATDREL